MKFTCVDPNEVKDFFYISDQIRTSATKLCDYLLWKVSFPRFFFTGTECESQITVGADAGLVGTKCNS